MATQAAPETETPERFDDAPGSWSTGDDGVVVVLDEGEELSVDGEVVRGRSAFAPDREWVVTGKYVRFDEPRPTTVGASVEGLEHVYDAPGQVEFEIVGPALRLTAFPGKNPEDLSVLFTDATSGVTTHAANPVVQVPMPAADGSVVLDFNRAVNLPCAYTDLATCPLPPAANRLPIAVEAGEQIPFERRG